MQPYVKLENRCLNKFRHSQDIGNLKLNLPALILIVRSTKEILYDVAVELYGLAVFVIEMVAHNNCVMSEYCVPKAVLG